MYTKLARVPVRGGVARAREGTAELESADLGRSVLFRNVLLYSEGRELGSSSDTVPLGPPFIAQICPMWMFLVYSAAAAAATTSSSSSLSAAAAQPAGLINVAMWEAPSFVPKRTVVPTSTNGTAAWWPAAVSISVNGGPAPNLDGCLVSVGWTDTTDADAPRAKVTVTSILTGGSYVDCTLYHGHPCPSFWLGPELSLQQGCPSARRGERGWRHW